MKSSYDHYVNDTRFLSLYDAYQEKYAIQIPERDKITLQLIAKATGGKGSLLDIGCSTGNLMLHAKGVMPELELTGGELAESSLDVARKNVPGARFERMDMLDIRGRYDVIVANAVAVYFGYDEYEAAIRSVAKALNPGGHYIAFEWIHPFDQEITIVERSVTHPDGLTIHYRPMEKVREIMTAAGLKDIKFMPFEIPIDLPHPGYTGDVATYTVRAENGARMQFRGALYQPWCHVMSQIAPAE